MYRKKTQALIKASSLLRGGFCMISKSGGLKPRAVAGGPSVTRFTHSSCTGTKPSGIPNAAVMKMEATSPIFDDIMYLKMHTSPPVRLFLSFKMLGHNCTYGNKTRKHQPRKTDLMKAFILSYIERPSPTAATMVLKLSSASTISAASLATCPITARHSSHKLNNASK